MPHGDPTAQAMEDARRRNVNASELAMLPMPYKPELLPARAIIEIKTDGIGLLDLNGRLESLEGVPFECAMHLAPELTAIRDAFGQPMVLHGEYFEREGFNATLAAFNRGVGYGACVLWDAVPLKAWHGYELGQPLIDRRDALKAAIQAVQPQMVAFVPTADWDGTLGLTCWEDSLRLTPEIVQVAAESTWAAGQEGIVIKDADSPYSRGRSPFWLKVKQTESIDVPIQSARVEDGRLKSLVVTVDGKPAVVPTGFSEELRYQLDEFWTGRMVEVSHIGKTPSGALKGARFIRFRDDKAMRP